MSDSKQARVSRVLLQAEYADKLSRDLYNRAILDTGVLSIIGDEIIVDSKETADRLMRSTNPKEGNTND